MPRKYIGSRQKVALVAKARGPKPLSQDSLSQSAKSFSTPSQEQTNGQPVQISKSLRVESHILDRYKSHVAKWAERRIITAAPSGSTGLLHHGKIGCTSCDLCKGRKKVVLFRGYLPCDILFVGEAPGESEDAIGVPFVGEAGHRLNSMIFAAYANTPEQEGNCMEMSSSGVVGNSRGCITYAVTNVVSCIPRETSDTSLGDIRIPTKLEAEACQERLLEAVRLANPKRIVALGEIARRFCSPKLINTADLARWDGQIHTMIHPSRVLHIQDENPRDALLLEKKFVIALSTVIRSL